MNIWMMIAILGVACLIAAICVNAVRLKARERRALLARDGKGSLMDFDQVDDTEVEVEATLEDFRTADEIALATRRLHFKDGLFEVYMGLLMLPLTWLHLIDNYIPEKYDIPVHIASAVFLVLVALLFGIAMMLKNLRQPQSRPGLWIVVCWVMYAVGVFIGDVMNVIWIFPVLVVPLSLAMYRHTRYARSLVYAAWSVITFPIAYFVYQAYFVGVEPAVDWVYLANIALFTLAPTIIGGVVAVKHFTSGRKKSDEVEGSDLTTAMEGSD